MDITFRDFFLMGRYASQIVESPTVWPGENTQNLTFDIEEPNFFKENTVRSDLNNGV